MEITMTKFVHDKNDLKVAIIPISTDIRVGHCENRLQIVLQTK